MGLDEAKDVVVEAGHIPKTMMLRVSQLERLEKKTQQIADGKIVWLPSFFLVMTRIFLDDSKGCKLLLLMVKRNLMAR